MIAAPGAPRALLAMLALLLLAATCLAAAGRPAASRALPPSTPTRDDAVVIEKVTGPDGIAGLRASIAIDAPREAIWKVLVDYDRMRDLYPNVTQLTVLGTTPAGALVRYRIRTMLMNFEYTLQRNYEVVGERLTWYKTAGDFRQVRGQWLIHDTAVPGRKQLICETFVDIGFAVPTVLVRDGAIREMRRTMVRIRERLERRSGNDESVAK